MTKTHSPRFKELIHATVDFDHIPISSPQYMTNSLGQVVALECIHEDSATGSTSIQRNASDQGQIGMVVCNHHLYWSPHAQFDKFRQSIIMLSQARQIRDIILQRDDMNSVFALMCGGMCLFVCSIFVKT